MTSRQYMDVFASLAPAFALAAWFIVGVFVYALRARFRGRVRDADMENRGDSFILGMWIRQYFVWITQPVWLLILRSGVPANAVTMLSALLGLGSGAAFAAGHFALGGWLYIFSGTLDVFDGRLARAQETSGPRGAVLDSVLDRYVDAAVLVGLSWYYRESWVLAFTLSALVGSSLVSYVRARGEGVGVSVRIGMMQRPERIVTLGALTALSPLAKALYAPGDPQAPEWLAIAGIITLSVSTQLTALRRFVHVLRSLAPDVEKPQRPRTPRAWLERGGLGRAVTTAMLATGSDFVTTLALVEVGAMAPWVATALGCGVGAVVGFSVARHWAFGDVRTRASLQAGRYVFTSATGMMLNAGGVYLLTLLPTVSYLIAWLIVRALVFLAWSYPLHRDYVFGAAIPAVAEESASPLTPHGGLPRA